MALSNIQYIVHLSFQSQIMVKSLIFSRGKLLLLTFGIWALHTQHILVTLTGGYASLAIVAVAQSTMVWGNPSGHFMLNFMLDIFFCLPYVLPIESPVSWSHCHSIILCTKYLQPDGARSAALYLYDAGRGEWKQTFQEISLKVSISEWTTNFL